jgi:hypothetical protein
MVLYTFNFYIPRQQARGQKTLDQIVASIPRIYGRPNWTNLEREAAQTNK